MSYFVECPLVLVCLMVSHDENEGMHFFGKTFIINPVTLLLTKVQNWPYLDFSFFPHPMNFFSSRIICKIQFLFVSICSLSLPTHNNSVVFPYVCDIDILKSTNESFSLDFSDAFSLWKWSYEFFWQEFHKRDILCFSEYHIVRFMMAIFLNSGDANFVHLLKVVSAGFFNRKVMIFWYKHLLEVYLWDYV